MTQSRFPRDSRGSRRRSSYRPRASRDPRDRYSARRSPYRRTANTREDAERYVIQTLGPHVDSFDVDGMLEDLNWELDGWDYSRFQEEDFWELAAFHDNTRTRRWDTPGGYRNRPRDEGW